MTMFASLRVRNYRYFASGQIVSLTGTWMQRVAQDWLVLQLSHDSGTAIGITTGLQFLPTLLFSMFGGVLADRYPKRRLLLCTQVASGATALVLGLLDVTGVVTLWHVYLLAFTLGVAASSTPRPTSPPSPGCSRWTSASCTSASGPGARQGRSGPRCPTSATARS
jgi:MFS family permease